MELDGLGLALLWEVAYSLYGPGTADRLLPDDGHWRERFVRNRTDDWKMLPGWHALASLDRYYPRFVVRILLMTEIGWPRALGGAFVRIQPGETFTSGLAPSGIILDELAKLGDDA